MRPELRPLTLLKSIKHSYPDVENKVEHYRQNKNKMLAGWKNFCFMPKQYWEKVYEDVENDNNLKITTTDKVAIRTITNWEVSKSIYYFDPTIYWQLLATTLPVSIPNTIFLKLREHCAYHILPNYPIGNLECFGFYVSLMQDVSLVSTSLLITLDTDAGLFEIPFLLDMNPSEQATKNIEASLNQVDVASLDGALGFSDQQDFAITMTPLINMVLYTISKNARFSSKKDVKFPTRTAVSRGSRNRTLLKPKTITEWHVGYSQWRTPIAKQQKVLPGDFKLITEVNNEGDNPRMFKRLIWGGL